MFVKQIMCGGDRNFGYVVADEESKKCALIDPSPDPDPAIRVAESNGFEILYVINTHDHYDHTAGNEEVKRVSDAKLVLHSSSARAEIGVDDGDILPLGNLSLKFLHTPGHTSDSICILVEKTLFTGDTLFVGKIGGTYGRENAMVEFGSLKRLMELDDDVPVWPGHNYGVKPSSTIGEERQSNPFIKRLNDFEAFYDLKQNWAEYKRRHGIA